MSGKETLFWMILMMYMGQDSSKAIYGRSFTSIDDRAIGTPKKKLFPSSLNFITLHRKISQTNQILKPSSNLEEWKEKLVIC